jgi:hypothetical protein
VLSPVRLIVSTLAASSTLRMTNSAQLHASSSDQTERQPERNREHARRLDIEEPTLRIDENVVECVGGSSGEEPKTKESVRTVHLPEASVGGGVGSLLIERSM